MKKKYLLGVGGHICSACCLKANTTIMPVYTCFYSSPLHTKQSKTKTGQRGKHNTGWHQGDRALLLLSAWSPIHKVPHHPLFTQSKLSVSNSTEWVLPRCRGFLGQPRYKRSLQLSHEQTRTNLQPQEDAVKKLGTILSYCQWWAVFPKLFYQQLAIPL